MQLACAYCSCIGIGRVGTFISTIRRFVANSISLLIIAHLTALEMYQYPCETLWTVGIRRPVHYRGTSFSSASTLYERDTGRNYRGEQAIKRKPVPQSTSVPGEFQCEPAPALSPPMMSRATRPEYHISRLPNSHASQEDFMPLESALSISACSCGHTSHLDERWVPRRPTSNRTRASRAGAMSCIKKSCLCSRYLFA